MNKGMIILMVTLMLGVVGSVSADSLISHWEFNEGSGTTTADSADGNTATLVNTEGDEWTTANCAVGVSVFEFDGVDDYLYVPYNANLDSGDGGEFTIAFWMRAPEPQQSEVIRIGTSNTQGGTYSGKRWSISIDYTSSEHSRLIFTVDDGTIERALTSFSNIDFTQWHYYVLRRYTVNYALLNMSVDGTLYGVAGAWAPPNPPTGDLVETGEDLYIGCKGPDENYEGNFKGQLADIRYYDYIVPGEIQDSVVAETGLRSSKTSCPNPDDGAENVPLNTNLRWAGPYDANEFFIYDVYLDDDDDLSDVTPIEVIGGSEPNLPNSEIGALTKGNYWWRVDAYDPNGTPVRTGDVWTFNAGATLPVLVNPGDGTGGYGLSLVLEWDSDVESGIVDHSELTITNVTTTDSVTVDVTDLDPFTGEGSWQCDDPATLGVMDYDNDFTWQIVDVDSGGNPQATGPIWSFSTFALKCGLNYDLDGDCVITLDDLALLASEWLDCNWIQANDLPIPYPSKDPCLQ